MISNIMKIVGSWVSLILMAVLAVGWATYNRVRNKPSDTIDIVISIWTMLLDVLVIIAANRANHVTDMKLDQIVKKLEADEANRRTS